MNTLPKELQTLGPEELALILRKSVNTIKRDASRSPTVLPPRIVHHGKKRPLLWSRTVVEQWLTVQGVPLP